MFFLKEDTQLLEEIVVVGESNTSIFSSNRTGAQEIISRDKNG